MPRRNVLKIPCIALALVIATNVFLAFYTKRTLQKLIWGDLQKQLHLPLSEWNRTVIERLSHLEVDLQNLKESMKLAMKQEENVDNTVERVKYEEHPVQKTLKVKASETKEHKPKEILFPDSQLFRQWGEDLSEAQQKKAEDLFQEFGYNVYLSNQLPLNRTIPDTRDSRCLQKTYSSQLPSLGVILIFMNEALSIIQRAITSIINRTPTQLLKEIILVDDFSSNGELKAHLDEKIKLYNQKYPGLLKIIRHTKRKGLAQARNTGREVATADVIAILDAHVEVNVGWAEPILARIQEDRTVIVSPVFDNINFDTFELDKYALAVDGFNWKLWCRYDPLPEAWFDLHDVTAPIKSPSIMGILAANRIFLGEIGSLDGGMLVYGGENVELSLRVWQCGGRVEVLPCSRIAHLERNHKPYALDLSVALKRNALRVAEIWMDEYKHMVYLAWNIPIQMKNTLDENLCLDQELVSGKTLIMFYCCKRSLQNVYYHLTGELYVGPLIAEANIDDHCLTDPGDGEKPTLEPCSKAAQNRLHIYWDFKPGRAVMNRATKRCLEMKKDTLGTYVPVLQNCTTQAWTIQYTMQNWGQTNIQ
ncbi:probable polypeptide N-acetylgalactosaminyltransferase 8 isoform X7 [Canis lupus familiaris]|uniref:Polypeptide N-acetylgalactosaminyltransferase n=1 Tax=Canis lupus familiaris TaxID=9615 RepID=A0A8P0PG45_CANLF|nr:probable polypeptide N-acetylgalactosaminyltransferase 8 isoform X7 [Canis lupus familiaris]